MPRRERCVSHLSRSRRPLRYAEQPHPQSTTGHTRNYLNAQAVVSQKMGAEVLRKPPISEQVFKSFKGMKQLRGLSVVPRSDPSRSMTSSFPPKVQQANGKRR